MAEQPTDPAPFAAGYLVNGANVCAHPYARCEPCQYGQCPGGTHSWAGPEDRIHAIDNNLLDPATQKCGCDCTDGPELDQPEPDYGEVTFSDLQECPVCGEHGPCGYDAEGRPMVHTDVFDDDSDLFGDDWGTATRGVFDVPTGGLV